MSFSASNRLVHDNITLMYLIPTVLLFLPVVAQQQPNNQDSPAFGLPSPPFGPINGEVHPLWVWLTAQIQDLASSLADNGADIPQALAAVVEDRDDPFWAWLATQMDNDLSSLAIDDTVIQPVLTRAAENNEDPLYMWLAAEVFANLRSPTTGDTDPSLRRRAIEAKPRRNHVLEWLETFFDAFRLF
ncbi:hypothetical protein FOZ63_029151 [Perkinsus olseni]|uniref:Uncharacterized protein n=1 Tax=Perkinsus olseni TaxID=32597 RepID=A0A7J6S5N9_PEROL|nr:hypothetical protein FOZ60_001094 [Perkinsus olseni]KAF4723011.1 hypothetical protein FOZ62_031921 [Perkinsus olseni]KAF4728218.1 hypothetical protein FOZ63_029151 [Perkinsus olseni]